MNRVMARVIFYTTLYWEAVCCCLQPWRHWWDEVDEGVILGAMPSRKNLAQLQAMEVRAIINMCEEHECSVARCTPYGMDAIQLPTRDRCPPSLQDIVRAMDFIAEYRKRGDGVYIHCRAGRGRGATVALCWLIKSQQVTPSQAFTMLAKRRRQVDAALDQREAVQQFWRDCGQAEEVAS